MFLLPHWKLVSSANRNSSKIILMRSKHFLLPESAFSTITTHASVQTFHTSSLSQTLFYPRSRKKFIFSPAELISPFFKETAGYQRTPYRKLVSDVNIESLEDQLVDPKQLMILRQKLLEMGIDCNTFTPGQCHGLICPMCKGGELHEKTLSLLITKDGCTAMWTCFRARCRWRGTIRAFADVKSTYRIMNEITKIKQPIREITEEGLGIKSLNKEVAMLLVFSFADTEKAFPDVNLPGQKYSPRPLTVENLRLEVLGDELITYFAQRMISKKTLWRNNVMQVTGDRKIIAFPYQRNGVIVGCKYRMLQKRFWQEKDTHKMLYGLDDIAEADEIIIVEGEIDKLSMEEAGFYNCVSVPNGAPPKVSFKELPSQEKDTRYQFLWNCKDYFDKASRIILATDGDIPGQALAEELRRRLGKERCLQVNWPKKDELKCFKDANEVLKHLGADAIRAAVYKAKLHTVQNLNEVN